MIPINRHNAGVGAKSVLAPYIWKISLPALAPAPVIKKCNVTRIRTCTVNIRFKTTGALTCQKAPVTEVYLNLTGTLGYTIP